MNKIVGFEQIHLHSHVGSLLDGHGNPESYAERAPKINQKFLCITDHGMMSAIPRQIKTCEDNNIFPIFGCELYLNNMQPDVSSKDEYEKFTQDLNEEEKLKLRKSYHLLAIAYNNVGYSNLVRLNSWAWIHGLGGRPKRPRVTYEQLLKYKEGIIFSSACYGCEIARAWESGGDEAGFAMVEKYKSMIGDNFYLELMLLDFKKQKPYDEFLIRAYDKYKIPLVISNDCS